MPKAEKTVQTRREPPRRSVLEEVGNAVTHGIGALAGRCWRELSGGQQQRVLLARALCATRELLFLDEPVAGLDPRVTEDMYALIASLHREGTTILMVTHDLPAAMRYATHILHIGEPVFFGTREAYLENPAFLRFREGKGGDPA